MNDAHLYNEWTFWLIVAAVLVVAAAALLILVIVQARRILRIARIALGVVEEIKNNTMPVWELQSTNQTATQILQEAEQIGDHLELVARNLPDNS